MKIRIILTLFTISLASLSFSQEKKDLKISLATGFYNSTHFTNAKQRQFYNFSFDYSIKKRHIISTDFISGQFRYYDDVLVTSAIPLTTPGYEHHTNVEASNTIFSVLYKYKIIDQNKFSIIAGAGLGIINETQTYPVDIPNGGFTFMTSGTKGDLCFPIRFEINYLISKQFQTGLIAGAFVYPDYPVVGQHLGIRLSYIIK